MSMGIPAGDWVVVVRPVRGEGAFGRGQILKGGLSERQARDRAKRGYMPGYNCWAMRRVFY